MKRSSDDFGDFKLILLDRPKFGDKIWAFQSHWQNKNKNQIKYRENHTHRWRVFNMVLVSSASLLASQFSFDTKRWFIKFSAENFAPSVWWVCSFAFAVLVHLVSKFDNWHFSTSSFSTISEGEIALKILHRVYIAVAKRQWVNIFTKAGRKNRTASFKLIVLISPVEFCSSRNTVGIKIKQWCDGRVVQTKFVSGSEN